MPASATSSIPPAATSNTSLQSAIIDDTDIMEDPALAATLELLSDEAENFEVDAETITAASASKCQPHKTRDLTRGDGSGISAITRSILVTDNDRPYWNDG